MMASIYFDCLVIFNHPNSDMKGMKTYVRFGKTSNMVSDR